jgi:hypothetical protein
VSLVYVFFTVSDLSLVRHACIKEITSAMAEVNGHRHAHVKGHGTHRSASSASPLLTLVPLLPYHGYHEINHPPVVERQQLSRMKEEKKKNLHSSFIGGLPICP